MKELSESRRRFLKAAGLTTGAVSLSSCNVVAESGRLTQSSDSPASSSESGSADYTLHLSLELRALRQARYYRRGTGRNVRDDLCEGQCRQRGFNRWTINGVAYPMSSLTMPTGK
jgi:hypothetical protein